MDKQNLIKGNKFLKLQQKAKELGAQSLDYSKRKNSKYVVTLDNGKKIHFGSPYYEDFLVRNDKIRQINYLKRATKIQNKQGEFTYRNPESANFWAVNLLW